MKRVLVVDDNASNLYLLRQLLQSSGYDVDEARHGQEALEKARSHAPDVLISDLLMPEMDGYALLSSWRSDEQLCQIPFIVYTATYTDTEDERLALDMGANAFVVKPAEPDSFMATISGAIQEAAERSAPRPAPLAPPPRNQGLAMYNAALVRKLEKRTQELEVLAAERQQALEALHNSENQFRALADHSLDMIMQSIPGGGVLWANAAACTAFGRTHAQMLQADRTELLDFSDPRLEGLFAARAATGRMRGEATALRANGTRFPVEISSVLYESPTGQQVSNFTMRDLSSQKAAESALQESQSYIATLHSAMDAHAMLSTADSSGNITYVNERYCAVSGFSREELIGQNHRLLRSGLHGPSDYQRLWETIQAGQVWRGTFCNRAKDGSLFWVDTTIVPFVETDGRVTQYVAIHNDVTERKRAERQREELEAQLREAQKLQAVGTLASGIAHDFNNIVAAILGYSSLMQEELEPTGLAEEYLGQIQKAGKRARDLVQRIMSFSRPQPTTLTQLVLQDEIQETLAISRATLPASMALQTQMQEAPVHVRADGTQLQQVLLNLYTNAWHAMPSESARVVTGLDTRELALSDPARPPDLPPGHYAHLWVQDNGQGMTEAVRSRIFEPFFTTKPMGQGTGLGLSAVRSIIAAHQGAITVTSEPGTGSTFHVYLPLAAEPDSAESPAPERAVVQKPSRSLHALYVDDDEPIAVLAKALLERAGFRVTAFAHAEQALAAVRAHARDFDLLVTDFNMPGMSGLELARRVQSIRQGLPIAIVSGHIDAELRKSAQDIQIDTLIHKERVVDDLVRRLHQMMMDA